MAKVLNMDKASRIILNFQPLRILFTPQWNCPLNCISDYLYFVFKGLYLCTYTYHPLKHYVYLSSFLILLRSKSMNECTFGHIHSDSFEEYIWVAFSQNAQDVEIIICGTFSIMFLTWTMFVIGNYSSPPTDQECKRNEGHHLPVRWYGMFIKSCIVFTTVQFILWNSVDIMFIGV